MYLSPCRRLLLIGSLVNLVTPSAVPLYGMATSGDVPAPSLSALPGTW